jgi:hypothetical protein
LCFLFCFVLFFAFFKKSGRGDLGEEPSRKKIQ